MTIPITDDSLAGVRVLDLAVAEADHVTRILADLGADVLKVEPPRGAPGRTRAPLVAGRSLAFGLNNANKRSVVLDPSDADDRHRFDDLVAGADIVVDSPGSGQLVAFGTTAAALASRYHHLVTMSVTDFGTQGPRAAWRATDAVLVALSSVLSRSGPPGGAPVLPPSGIASATAAAQAAWAVLVAYYQRLRTGRGDYIDFSRYDAVLQALDPPFGAQGQAAAARGVHQGRPGRPRHHDPYPIFACRDGWVRICVLAPRQWRAMRAWLGEPPAFQDPEFDTISARARAFADIGAAIAALFAQHTEAELVAEGANRGVPVAAVLTSAEVLTADQFRAVGAWTRAELSTDVVLDVPDGCFTVDGRRAGVRWLARPLGVDAPHWLSPSTQPCHGERVRRPFEGLRILDLGVIVAGGELGRLFADLGAEVIKVESPAYPDGLRQAGPGKAMSESFAWTHRNRYGLGVDLRTDDGAALFAGLVARADAVFANFKPGTLTGLGFGAAALQQLNPGVILTESSAYGDHGPWSTRLGYGPLVRASTGITASWTAEGAAHAGHAFCDGVTVFPDHLVARLAATATLAALIRRRRTGAGAHIHISQAEAAVSQLDVAYAAAWARDAGLSVTEETAVHDVYPCAGEDEWCVVSIADDRDWRAVTQMIGRPGLADDPRFACGTARRRHRAELRTAVSEFTRRRASGTVAQLAQRLGVAAGPVQRAADVLTDPQVRSRGLYSDMSHPLLDVTLPTETGPAPYRHIPPAELRPAPLLGEHTRQVCAHVLDTGAEEIDRLLADGVLFGSPVSVSTPKDGTT